MTDATKNEEFWYAGLARKEKEDEDFPRIIDDVLRDQNEGRYSSALFEHLASFLEQANSALEVMKADYRLGPAVFEGSIGWFGISPDVINWSVDPLTLGVYRQDKKQALYHSNNGPTSLSCALEELALQRKLYCKEGV